jgi:hypothetical protein
MAMNDDLMESLLHEEESSALDFKRDQYPFVGATNDEKSEPLKDVLACANAWRRATAYILIGVEEVKGGRSIVHGVAQHLNDNDLQQFVNSKANRPVQFSYEAFPFEGKQVGVIIIPCQKRPFLLSNDYGKLKKQTVYTRQGSSTNPASVDEVARMASADAIDDMMQKELEEQRRDREQQRKLQRELHAETYRPNVVCDFPIVHTILYLRIKNYGNLPAKDIKITVEGEVALPRVAALLHPISLLAPDAELYYWLFGPQEFGDVPKELMLDVSYTDLKGTRFEEKQRFDFAYFGIPGSGERGVDISRQNNDPVVRQLKEIAEALAAKKSRPSPFG